MLAAHFGIDPAAVSRYIKIMDPALETVLPTAEKISKEMASAETKDDFKKIVPEPDGGTITLGGTHCPLQRPDEKTDESHDVFWQEEKIHAQHHRVHKYKRGDNRHIGQYRGIHPRHYAAQGEPAAVWRMVGQDVR